MVRFVTLFLLLLLPLRAALLPVRFIGNHHVPTSKLYEIMGIPEPLFFEFWKEKPRIDPDKVKALLPAIESYYKSVGFYHARADAEVKKGVVLITIKENAPIRVKDVSTISPLPIGKLIPFKTGDIFNAEAFVKSKKEIKRYYRDHHYCNVQLNAKSFVDIVKNEAYLVYDVTPNRPCRFGKISITTPPTVEKRIVHSLLLFKEGDPYSTEAIRRSYRELYSNEGIERVVIDDTSHDGNVVPVHVSVTTYEKPVHFSAGAGYSTDEGINLQAGIKHRNFLGNLKTVGLNAYYSQIKHYIQLEGEMPLPHHNRLSFRTGVKKEIFDGYDEYSVMAKINLKQIRPPHYFEEGILIEELDTRNSRDPETFPNGKLLIVSPTLGWKVDTRDNMLDPRRGYRIIVDGMGSVRSALSDATYYKISAEGAFHKELGRAIAAVRLRLGSIDVFDGRIPPSYRFYAGGMNSNRGWNYRQLGPKNRYGDPTGAFSIAEGSLELRMPIGETFRWVLFSDVTFMGYDPYPDFGKAYVAAGPGIRYMSPMGPIALDFGVDVEDPSQYAIHFHIGELF
ncbi:BamA/TamA family outer membrane protein [Hydrogenimonas sp. SS33]|uniref:autotransporter assembly complex protein TamA n=1 Tax=Hydrogenimonas leucolamina TaxID=2954236 RepID=UPI00336C2C19